MDTSREIRAVGGEGILTKADMLDLEEAQRRVFHLMKDRKWHAADEIRMVAGSDGHPASEGLKRMRTLRPKLHSRGFVLNKSKVHGSRLFQYRIEVAPVCVPEPGCLF